MALHPSEMNEKVSANVQDILNAAASNKNRVSDSTLLIYYKVLRQCYSKNGHAAYWSNEEKWTPNADLLIRFLHDAALNGLYKEDYHFEKIVSIKKELDGDSVKRTNTVLWANADVIFSDAYAGILKDLAQGRLVKDSTSYKNDTAKYRTFFEPSFEQINKGENVNNILAMVQPKYREYLSLKSAIKNFTDSMDNRNYTYLNYPFKDSASFIKTFKKRMAEEGITIAANADSTQLAVSIKKYQKLKNLVVDGKIGNSVVKRLNFTDKQKFNVIAITLDKYKLLPREMPLKYIWVNLPSYNLKLWSNDTVAVESKIICGKPATPTPNITSAIDNIVLYPTWTVPTSIIAKDMLPGLKRSSNYLARKGLYLLNAKGERINAAAINWGKYKNGIPYRVQQGSGDNNAMGVIKFNFENPFSVYLHDTNQRYLFKNGVRCLSHGCVRVQEWQQLANYIVRNDSMSLKKTDTLSYNTDSISSWIAQKQKHSLKVKNKMPLFIRYITCETINGYIKFYDDIYGEDKVLKQQFFPAK
ncbi:MAG: L,D-transpeptidase family protein [Ferruginibacter sp.]